MLAAPAVLIVGGMKGVDRLEDLVTWQLVHELNVEVIRFTSRPPASGDFEFREQIRDAADSAERNVAEGFGRYGPTGFAHFLDISRASLHETRGLLLKAQVSGYLSEPEFRRLDALAVRGLQAVAGFQRYLRSPDARRNAERNRYRRRRRHGANDSNPPNDPNVPNVPNDPNAPNDPNDPNA